jgi:hypothetical protein
METIGLFLTALCAALWFYGDYQGWPAYYMAAILLGSSALVAYMNARYRFHLCVILAVAVIGTEYYIRTMEPRMSDVYLVSPSMYTLGGMAVVVAMLGCVMGGFFRTVFGPEQHPHGF